MVSRTVAVALGILIFALGCATGKLPGQSVANYILQRDALGIVMLLDRAADNNVCTQRKIINTEIVEPPPNPGKDPWVEKWTVDRCGQMDYYKVTFTPTPKIGGTDFGVSGWK